MYKIKYALYWLTLLVVYTYGIIKTNDTIYLIIFALIFFGVFVIDSKLEVLEEKIDKQKEVKNGWFNNA